MASMARGITVRVRSGVRDFPRLPLRRRPFERGVGFPREREEPARFQWSFVAGGENCVRYWASSGGGMLRYFGNNVFFCCLFCKYRIKDM